jgi:hypothetical protein
LDASNKNSRSGTLYFFPRKPECPPGCIETGGEFYLAQRLDRGMFIAPSAAGGKIHAQGRRAFQELAATDSIHRVGQPSRLESELRLHALRNDNHSGAALAASPALTTHTSAFLELTGGAKVTFWPPEPSSPGLRRSGTGELGSLRGRKGGRGEML